MESKIIVNGKHQRKGFNFFSKTHKFLICERAKTTPTKTKLFLIAKSVNKRLEKDTYISSLYPIAQNVFKIDYNGCKYTVVLSADWATITPLDGLKTR